MTAGTDLTGGGTSGNVTLNVDTTKVPQLNSANTFTGNQTVNGTMTATSFSGSSATFSGTVSAPTFNNTGSTWQSSPNFQLSVSNNTSSGLLYIVPAKDSGGFPTVNVLGGSSTNSIASGVGGATIAGGGANCNNCANSVTADYGTVGGGDANTASGRGSTVGGGGGSLASGRDSTVGGGDGNLASGDDSTVAGGYSNTASGQFSTVAGGYNNTASGIYASVGGGQGNSTTGVSARTFCGSTKPTGRVPGRITLGPYRKCSGVKRRSGAPQRCGGALSIRALEGSRWQHAVGPS